MYQDKMPISGRPIKPQFGDLRGPSLSESDIIGNPSWSFWSAAPYFGPMCFPSFRDSPGVVTEKPKIVVLGSGFGAAGLLKNIDHTAYDITLISPRNHFLFTPLLASSAVGTLELRSIAEPVRELLGPNDIFYRAKAEKIDRQRKVVICKQVGDDLSFEVPYDKLVISVGAVTNSFGIPGVKENCSFLKDSPDSAAIRAKVINLFEKASLKSTPVEEKYRLLSFVIIGGGPTGVEFTGELSDFARREASRAYSRVKDYVRISLIEAGPSILTVFSAPLQEHALATLRKNNVQVRTGIPVVAVDPEVVKLKDGSAVPFGLAVWSSGIKPNEVVNQLGVPLDSRGRVTIDKRLKVAGADDIYALGDCAAIASDNLAPTAQVANQQGLYLGKAFNRMSDGKVPAEFAFKDQGRLAYVGGGDAVADLPFAKVKGFPAWVFWRSVYLSKLSSVRSQIQVCFDWAKGALFGRDTSEF